jgi:hypothetical protein
MAVGNEVSPLVSGLVLAEAVAERLVVGLPVTIAMDVEGAMVGIEEEVDVSEGFCDDGTMTDDGLDDVAGGGVVVTTAEAVG